MLLGKYTVYMQRQYEVLDYDKKNKIIKLKSDDSDLKYKTIKRSDVEQIYYIQTNCIYKGYKFQVISEKEDSILIYTSNNEVGVKLNMEFIERSVYHKWIRKSEVDTILEDKTILNL
ncbi:hypothetical protein BJV85_001839 [Clostridium acetobutylicum]|uniref:Uncharacterized protein n=1 Tax=Clostridium acetobutylicum (strain ATCC 824 / DSM 792 / JCM 1419 / IAM 19013 / LMG 5710 / NBRC 13948 / NRRL B-527 / VKM B-1787 / 2291 / W) TaxID=272562 RepID=Q97HH3_CLOAB|nr:MULTISPECIES: hypothetical protein [Clostridium]AAK79997.1 Hypothetical protein, CF-23 family [Clostridium acetobutylicum ATCC 824]ADZ21089.1 conserved hypothetical protein [Clostridium acetobutylicum EA 2018]AEI32145.1 hypothetical protein SMB_G2070 [Clostridium acetobutylicum DSM 1731]AWV79573.1 hypothetical protein DK921_05555 [Clostridium acetobutylicum]MBC2394453.1 hypothetical protein [Clostridium acetobutylicum]